MAALAIAAPKNRQRPREPRLADRKRAVDGSVINCWGINLSLWTIR
jgi:hypothetical protein